MARRGRKKRANNGIRWGRVLVALAVIACAAYALYRNAELAQTRGTAIKQGLEQARELTQDAAQGLALPPPPPAVSASRGGIEVFFAPADPAASDGIDDHFIALLQSATRSIDAAFYELDFTLAADALIAQHARGVRVRLVADEDYKDEAPLQRCLAAGMSVVLDGRGAFMHNKFCIVDGAVVWTGSTNVTDNCLYKNNNNSLRIASAELAENYTVEFNEMFESRLFGRNGTQNTPHPRITIRDVHVQCYFSPDDGAEAAILNVLDKARQTIDFAAFSFTSESIAEKMAEKLATGIAVRGVFESRNAGSRYSRDDYLAERGARVFLDTNPHNMHHKFIVVDTRWVVTGSYNFSKNAETRNDENCLILESPAIAAAYAAELDRLIPSQ